MVFTATTRQQHRQQATQSDSNAIHLVMVAIERAIILQSSWPREYAVSIFFYLNIEISIQIWRMAMLNVSAHLARARRPKKTASNRHDKKLLTNLSLALSFVRHGVVCDDYSATNVPENSNRKWRWSIQLQIWIFVSTRENVWRQTMGWGFLWYTWAMCK